MCGQREPCGAARVRRAATPRKRMNKLLPFLLFAMAADLVPAQRDPQSAEAAAARGVNLVRGLERPQLAWDVQVLDALLASALLGYLAVAHHGRGRGAWVDEAPPSRWTVARCWCRETCEIYGVFRTYVWKTGRNCLDPADAASLWSVKSGRGDLRVGR